MAEKKTSRKELLKGTDEFLTFSSRAAEFILAHLRELAYIGLGLAVVLVGYLAVYTYFYYINKKGQTAYNKAYYELAEIMQADIDVDKLKDVRQRFETVFEDYSLSSAAHLALPQAAYLKFNEKRYDDAISLYRQFMDDLDDSVMVGLPVLALAACYEAKGELTKAIDTLRPVVATENDPFKETAMISLARLYRLNDQTEKAKQILQDFVETYRNSPFLPLAKSQL